MEDLQEQNNSAEPVDFNYMKGVFTSKQTACLCGVPQKIVSTYAQSELRNQLGNPKDKNFSFKELVELFLLAPLLSLPEKRKDLLIKSLNEAIREKVNDPKYFFIDERNTYTDDRATDFRIADKFCTLIDARISQYERINEGISQRSQRIIYKDNIAIRFFPLAAQQQKTTYAVIFDETETVPKIVLSSDGTPIDEIEKDVREDEFETAKQIADDRGITEEEVFTAIKVFFLMS